MKGKRSVRLVELCPVTRGETVALLQNSAISVVLLHSEVNLNRLDVNMG